GALRRSWSNSRVHFWKLRVAQPGWRVTQLNQAVEENPLEVARRAG
ncbi:hypothetical protein A2U01_0097816, partial [Trifolium medium]|nr:hypothetical protein [Trifolium medium]